MTPASTPTPQWTKDDEAAIADVLQDLWPSWTMPKRILAAVAPSIAERHYRRGQTDALRQAADTLKTQYEWLKGVYERTPETSPERREYLIRSIEAEDAWRSVERLVAELEQPTPGGNDD